MLPAKFDSTIFMDFKNAMSFIKHIKTENEFVIVKKRAVPSLFGYYYEKDYLKLHKKKLESSTNVLYCKSWQDVSIDINRYNRIIVVDAFEDLGIEDKDLIVKLSDQKKNKISLKKFKGVTITFYQ